MTTNIIIGVGGTGAKIVEAVIHCAVSGIGPETLRVGFVDQDQSNGNVSRARALLRTVEDARKLWRSGTAHHIDGDRTVGSDLLSTDIRALLPAGELWIPHPGRGMTLSRIFGDLGREDRALFDILFAKGPLEQEMKLDEGYRARPHIGSAAITAQVDQDADFWRTLLQQIRQTQQGGEVRLLLAGSVFGGTGAAGFPTLARLIRRRLKAEQIKQNISMAGVLMLPYFSFDPPQDENGVVENVARSEHLLIQSRGALKYYDSLFRHEHVFDEVYLAGWNRPFELGYHSPGAGEQQNPALAPELIAAIGACRFFDSSRTIESPEGDEAARANRVFVCAREDDNCLGWADLPPASREADDSYRKLGKTLRFSAAWKHWAPLVATAPGLARRINPHPWHRRQGLNAIDYTNAPPSDGIRKLTEYLDALLIWAASVQAYATANGTRFDLWRINDLMEGPPRFDTPQSLFTVRPSLTEGQFAAAFNTIVIPKPAVAAPPDANLLARRMAEQSMPGAHNGLGRLVAALHAYSAVTLAS